MKTKIIDLTKKPELDKTYCLYALSFCDGLVLDFPPAVFEEVLDILYFAMEYYSLDTIEWRLARGIKEEGNIALVIDCSGEEAKLLGNLYKDIFPSSPAA